MSYASGCATRDGWAADFEMRTGKNWYSHISKGRKPYPRYSASEVKRVPRPPRGAASSKTTKERAHGAVTTAEGVPAGAPSHISPEGFAS